VLILGEEAEFLVAGVLQLEQPATQARRSKAPGWLSTQPSEHRFIAGSITPQNFSDRPVPIGSSPTASPGGAKSFQRDVADRLHVEGFAVRQSRGRHFHDGDDLGLSRLDESELQLWTFFSR
jgi:hypothetical protein